MPVFTSADTMRPGFSAAMELLSTLPCHPRRALLSTLILDLGLFAQADATDIILALKNAGFEIFTSNLGGGDGRAACISRRAWSQAQAACESYWERVWEGPAKQVTQSTA